MRKSRVQVPFPALRQAAAEFDIAGHALRAWIRAGQLPVIQCGRKHLITCTILSRLQKIGDDAFSHCSQLESLTLPASLRTLGTRAFDECTNLRSVTFSEGLTTIGDDCFIS